MGFPTINQPVPRDVKNDEWGIYFSITKIDRRVFASLTHLGPPSTFGLKRATCETYILKFPDRALATSEITVKLLLKFREIEAFPTIAKLKKQIRLDVKLAKKFFHL